MRKTIILLAIFMLMSCPDLRAEDITLTVDEAISIALRDNRDILLKAEDLKKAKAIIAEADSSMFPSLSFTGSWSDTRGYYSKNIGQYSTQTTLKQYLYKGGKTINTIKYEGYNLEVKKAILDKTRLETVFNVTRAFYTLLLAEEYNNLNKQIFDNTKEHIKVIDARYNNGEASESDFLKARQSLSSVEEAYIASLGQVKTGREILKYLLFLDDDVNITLVGEFSYSPVEIAYDEAFLKAMKTRPEIKQYEAQLNADKKSIDITKADNRPSVYASWDYYSRSRITASTEKNWNDHNIIGVTFSWPIFDGWLTKAKVEQAIVDLKETRLLQEKSVQEISLDLKSAYLDLKNAVAKIKSSEAEAVLYQDMLKTTLEKYNAGMASHIDLNDATLGYHVSLFKQKQASYDYIQSRAKFDKAVGGAS